MLGSGEKGSRTDHEASGEGWGFIPGMLGSHWKALSMAAFQLAATFKSPSDGCVQPGSIGVSDTSSRAGEMVAGTLVREAVGLTTSVRGGEFPGHSFPLEQMQPKSLENKLAFFHKSTFLGSHQAGEEYHGGLALSVFAWPLPLWFLGQLSMLLRSLSRGVKS